MNKTRKDLKKTLLPILLLLTGIGTALVFIYLFAELAEEVIESEVQAFDTAIINLLQSGNSQLQYQIMFFITELGSVWFLSLLSLLTVLYLWIKPKDKWGILFFILNIAGGGLLTKVLKHYFGRERPSINEEIDAIGYSFPSGHSMGSLLFYGFIAYIIIRSAAKKPIKWTAVILAFLLVFLIGTSRIYLGAHFPSDVIAGHLAGGIWLILCILALEWVKWQSANSMNPFRTFLHFLEQRFK
ncbi:phosphatase PAP2 family protein [Bacillus sp. REN3]|uniref:phosphatase PAP2 family protein n=1 Tax=Bacillus sp. REN3 TaxID=2802440 RepID=UPI001AED7515|nr:phosphatase PAP2 family protein [Bacillus sp. REN3]